MAAHKRMRRAAVWFGYDRLLVSGAAGWCQTDRHNDSSRKWSHPEDQSCLLHLLPPVFSATVISAVSNGSSPLKSTNGEANWVKQNGNHLVKAYPFFTWAMHFSCMSFIGPYLPASSPAPCLWQPPLGCALSLPEEYKALFSSQA